MRALPVAGWHVALVPNESLLSSLGEAMKNDREMTVVGKVFTCTVLLASDAERYLVRFEDGKLGAKMQTLQSIGHFPMSEDHQRFMRYRGPIFDGIEKLQPALSASR